MEDDLQLKKKIKKSIMTTSKKGEDDLKKIKKREDDLKKNGRRPEQYFFEMENKPINRNQPNWL
jgi:hypothetical protein